jgi:hypothetical protein
MYTRIRDMTQETVKQDLPKGCSTIIWVVVAVIMFITFCEGLRNCAMITVD